MGNCLAVPGGAPAKPPEGKPADKPAEAKPVAAAKSTGSKLTLWGWQSFTPEGDKALEAHKKDWGKANNTDIEYVVVENAQFPQKLAAAIEAKAPPDVAMLTSPANVLDFASRDLFVDLADVWNDVSKQQGGYLDFVKDSYNIGNTYFAIPFEADTSPRFARLDLIEKATGKREAPEDLRRAYRHGEENQQPAGAVRARADARPHWERIG